MEHRGEKPVFGVVSYMDQDMLTEVHKPKIEVTKVTDGLGYGEGSISFRACYEEVGNEAINVAEQAILSPEIIVPVSLNKNGKPIEDDGCGDGRGVKRVFEGFNTILKKSLNRAKVFGAGLTMGTAARIATGDVQGDDLKDEYAATMDLFHAQGIGYGAHTDEHAHDENCGCGAIDKAPIIISNAVKFREQIRGSIAGLGIETDGVEDVLAQFSAASKKIDMNNHSGKKIANGIMDKGKIVKELAGDHLEMYIVLNMVKGFTVNQNLVRTKTDELVQTFAVDVWRLQEIAEKMYPYDLKQQHQAFMGELVYTLATAATLTDGSLPVFVVKEEFEYA